MLTKAALTYHDTEPRKFSASDVKRRYDLFNRKFFEDELPEIPIKLFKSKKLSGKVPFFFTKKDGGGLKMQLDSLGLSTTYKLSLQEMDEILLHEMIHVYFLNQGKMENHGANFQRMLKDLRRKSGVNIPLKDNFENRKLRGKISSVGVLLRYNANRDITLASFFTLTTLEKNLDYMISFLVATRTRNPTIADDTFTFLTSQAAIVKAHSIGKSRKAMTRFVEISKNDKKALFQEGELIVTISDKGVVKKY